jgi:hypothetical protein
MNVEDIPDSFICSLTGIELQQHSIYVKNFIVCYTKKCKRLILCSYLIEVKC